MKMERLIMPICAIFCLSLCASLFSDNGLSLTSAARSGNTELARRLVAAGADLNAQDEDGKTALDYAEERGNAEIAAMLEM